MANRKPPSERKNFSLPDFHAFDAVNASSNIVHSQPHHIMTMPGTNAHRAIALCNYLEQNIAKFEQPVEQPLPMFKQDLAKTSKPKAKSKKNDRFQMAIDFTVNQNDTALSTQPLPTRKLSPTDNHEAEVRLMEYCEPHSDDSYEMLEKRRDLTGAIASLRNMMVGTVQFYPDIAERYSFPDTREIVPNGKGGETLSMRIEEIQDSKPWLGNVLDKWYKSGERSQAFVHAPVSGNSTPRKLKQNKKTITTKKKKDVYIPQKGTSAYTQHHANNTHRL